MSAERQRRYRERIASGRRVLPVEVNFDVLPDVLIAGGHLNPLQADDPEAVRSALQLMLARLQAAHFRDA